MWFHVMSQQTLNCVLMDVNPPLWQTWFSPMQFRLEITPSFADICYRLRYLLQIALSSHGTSWQVSVTNKGKRKTVPVHAMNAYGGVSV